MKRMFVILFTILIVMGIGCSKKPTMVSTNQKTVEEKITEFIPSTDIIISSIESVNPLKEDIIREIALLNTKRIVGQPKMIINKYDVPVDSIVVNNQKLITYKEISDTNWYKVIHHGNVIYSLTSFDEDIDLYWIGFNNRHQPIDSIKRLVEEYKSCRVKTEKNIRIGKNFLTRNDGIITTENDLLNGKTILQKEYITVLKFNNTGTLTKSKTVCLVEEKEPAIKDKNYQLISVDIPISPSLESHYDSDTAQFMTTQYKKKMIQLCQLVDWLPMEFWDPVVIFEMNGTKI